MSVGVQRSGPVSVSSARKLKPSLEMARIPKQRPFLVWLGSVYQLLFASLGSCCGVHHSPQNSAGTVGGSALAALAHSAVVAAAAINRLFIVASSGPTGSLSCPAAPASSSRGAPHAAASCVWRI